MGCCQVRGEQPLHGRTEAARSCMAEPRTRTALPHTPPHAPSRHTHIHTHIHTHTHTPLTPPCPLSAVLLPGEPPALDCTELRLGIALPATMLLDNGMMAGGAGAALRRENNNNNSNSSSSGAVVVGGGGRSYPQQVETCGRVLEALWLRLVRSRPRPTSLHGGATVRLFWLDG